MRDVLEAINRIINALNTPAHAFNEVAATNNFPLVPVIPMVDVEKCVLITDADRKDAFYVLYDELKEAALLASAYQQELAKDPRDREQINIAKRNYEGARNQLIKRMEEVTSAA
jgi:hypothetical protein